MKNVIIALGLTLASSSAAFAGGSALDAVMLPQDTAAYTSTATVATFDGTNAFEGYGRLGDGTPVFAAQANGSIDYTATASIGDYDAGYTMTAPRLGDGILPY